MLALIACVAVTDREKWVRLAPRAALDYEHAVICVTGRAARRHPIPSQHGNYHATSAEET